MGAVGDIYLQIYLHVTIFIHMYITTIIKEKEFVEPRMGMWEGLGEKKGGMMQSCFNGTFKNLQYLFVFQKVFVF